MELDGDLGEAVSEGVRRATRDGYLRASVCDPLTRKNTGDNAPAVVHLTHVPGERLSISVLPKGCGSENMSRVFMLPPSKGREGILDAVVEAVRTAWANPCPPGIIGVGIGGTVEKAALMAKQALLRPVGEHSRRDDVRELEEELLSRINCLGMGPLGLGGNTCVLSVAAEVHPCHIASLPVAVNLQCHAARRAVAELGPGGWRHLTASEGPGIERPAVSFSGFRRVVLPLSKEVLASLKAGEWLLLSGPLLTARDQTHRLLAQMIREGRRLPVDLRGQLIYYVGPSPAPPGMAVGSAGPTTSYRMDAFTPLLLERGVAATMGKGQRGDEVRKAMLDHGAVYLATLGGAGAFLSRRIKSCQPVAFEELGPEALFQMEVEEFPAVVINDLDGNDYYDMVRKRAG